MNKIFKILQSSFFIFCLIFILPVNAQEKIKIGLLVPLTGNDKELGEQIIKSTRMALKDLNTNNIEIYTKDTNSCLLYTSPSPRDRTRSRMPSSA